MPTNTIFFLLSTILVNSFLLHLVEINSQNVAEIYGSRDLWVAGIEGILQWRRGKKYLFSPLIVG